MDLLHFLIRRLELLKKLYESAIAPLEEMKRKIEAGEEPYLFTGDPEHWDGEPPFLEEWQDADESVMVVGY